MLSRMPTDGQKATCSLGKSLAVCLIRSPTLSRGKGDGIREKIIGHNLFGNDGGNSIGQGFLLIHDASTEPDLPSSIGKFEHSLIRDQLSYPWPRFLEACTRY